MTSCPFCNKSLEGAVERCPACNAQLGLMSATTVDSGFVEAFVEPIAESSETEVAAIPSSKPKRSVRAFFRRIVDRTRGSHTAEKTDKDSTTDSRENVLTYQHTQPTFLDDTARTPPPAAEPTELGPSEPELADLELTDLEPLDVDSLVFAAKEEEAEGPRRSANRTLRSLSPKARCWMPRSRACPRLTHHRRRMPV